MSVDIEFHCPKCGKVEPGKIVWICDTTFCGHCFVEFLSDKVPQVSMVRQKRVHAPGEHYLVKCIYCEKMRPGTRDTCPYCGRPPAYMDEREG